MAEKHWGVDSLSLVGKVAVVSGGAGQYGTHISQALTAAGAHVSIAARTVKARRAAVDRLVGAGLKASADVPDLRSQDSISALPDEVVRTLGSVDILVNNAVVRGGGDVAQTTAAQRAATSEVSSPGLFMITQACGEQMIVQREFQSAARPRPAGPTDTPRLPQ